MEYVLRSREIKTAKHSDVFVRNIDVQRRFHEGDMVREES
jgi:hypothetical protein